LDKTTRILADYVTHLTFQQLPAKTVHAAKQRLVDTLGCAMGGYTSEPAAIARRIASRQSGEPSARILGSGARTSMEMATFANCVMARYLDYNDTYISVGSGHTSDMIPACLAVAEAHNASGSDLLLAIVAAYEVYTGLADVVPARVLGWDQGLYVVLGSAAGAAKLLGLTRDQTADAMAMAITANVPTRQTRSGELAMWKGVATAASARAGVFSALLAADGMTGPTAAFEGRHGVWDQVTKPFELKPLGGNGAGYGIERSNLKFFPSEYHSQAPLAMALELRAKVRVDDIEAIDIETYHMTYSEIGSEPEKWNPQTRETADHSLPYLLALGLVDGFVKADSFTPERMRDPQLHAIMQKIKIAENDEYTAQFPAKLVTKFNVRVRGGKPLELIAQYPKGHQLNPMSDAEIDLKFTNLCEPLTGAAKCQSLLAALHTIDQAPDIGPIFELTQIRQHGN
jgi:2-methylcitrate dehydratase